MRIVHDSTIRISKGWQTILRVQRPDEEEIGIVIRHDAPTSRVMAASMDAITAAVERETIIDRKELMCDETSHAIEEVLVEWISNQYGEQYRYARWRNELMHGFMDLEAATSFDTQTKQGQAPRAPSKKRIMLG